MKTCNFDPLHRRRKQRGSGSWDHSSHPSAAPVAVITPALLSQTGFHFPPQSSSHACPAQNIRGHKWLLWLLCPVAKLAPSRSTSAIPAPCIQHKKLLFRGALLCFSISHFGDHQVVSGGIEISLTNSLSGAIWYSE